MPLMKLSMWSKVNNALPFTAYDKRSSALRKPSTSSIVEDGATFLHFLTVVSK